MLDEGKDRTRVREGERSGRMNCSTAVCCNLLMVGVQGMGSHHIYLVVMAIAGVLDLRHGSIITEVARLARATKSARTRWSRADAGYPYAPEFAGGCG